MVMAMEIEEFKNQNIKIPRPFWRKRRVNYQTGDAKEAFLHHSFGYFFGRG